MTCCGCGCGVTASVHAEACQPHCIVCCSACICLGPLAGFVCEWKGPMEHVNANALRAELGTLALSTVLGTVLFSIFLLTSS